MSRIHRLLHSLASGYLAIAAAALYSLATVPLAFQFLTNEQFALWTLISTVSGYFAFIDLGISSAMSRLLIDVKDQKETGAYGALIQTGWLVSVVQAGIIVIVGFASAPVIVDLLAINPELERTCGALIRWQTALLGFGFLVRIFNQMLHAHQRIDVYNYAQIAAILVNFLGLWLFLKGGEGVFSVIWAQWLSQTISIAVTLSFCWRLRLFPSRREWGRLSWPSFLQVFSFGKDIFLVALGTQISMSCQVIVITRQLGLEAAAIWNVGTRLFSLGFQIIWRISDFAAPALSEMMVRGEQQTLRQRYRSLFIVTISLAGLSAVGLAICNSLFVQLWTKGRIVWPASYDVGLGLWLIALVGFRCHNSFLMLTKEVRNMHWVYLVESISLVTLIWFFAKHVGMGGVAVISAVCAVVFSGAYGVWRISEYFGLPVSEVAVDWFKPFFKLMACLVPLAGIAWWCGESLPVLFRFVLNLLFCVLVGGSFWVRYGMEAQMRKEIVARLPSSVHSIAKLLKLSR